MSSSKQGVLYKEHLILGAQFCTSEVSEAPYVGSYGTDLGEQAQDSKTSLCDLTGSCYLYLYGTDAPTFMKTVFCSKELAVGECGYCAALTGEGNLISVALVVRTGSSEYVIHDISPRALTLISWLNFMSKTELSGDPLYKDLVIEEAFDKLTALCLLGSEVPYILSDFIKPLKLQVNPGFVGEIALDSIPSVLAYLPASRMIKNACILYIPQGAARYIWRNLLSFTELNPVGVPAIWNLAKKSYRWGSLLTNSDIINTTKDDLMLLGLVRSDMSFVGYRHFCSPGGSDEVFH